MADHRVIPLGSGLWLGVSFTDATDGDFRVTDPDPGIEDRRRRIVDLPWSWVRQVHGTTVLEVSLPAQHAGAEADGLYTTTVGTAIAVTTADCAPVVLAAERGVAVVHAGWKGIVGGIIEHAAELLTATAGAPVASLVGPCISPAAYEFGRDDLDQVVARLGSAVESETSDGGLALDVPTAVALACQKAGWPAPERPACTSSSQWFSHRTRTDSGRQTAVAWLSEHAQSDTGTRLSE